MSKMTEEDVKVKLITPALQNKNWDPKTQMRFEYYYTDGKINVRGNTTQRSKGKKVDYLLYYKSNMPIAIVEAKDNEHQVADGLQQGIGYAEDLDVPFAYSSNGFGFREHDMITGAERNLTMDEFPTAQELWNRYKAEKNITPEEEKIIQEPYHLLDINKKPRYYQRIAINKTIEAISKGKDRILLVMATGTGKTFTAFQIIYRLWKSGAKKKILYLADRNILIDQTMQNDFKPFQKVMTKIENRHMDSSYEIYMSLYHQLRSSDAEIYKQFKPDFFDLIIVDECHRSSAKDDSNWHEILEYFSGATQIGMTATPKETNDVSNITYFGEPIYTYTLNQGIEDGYLAPYKVLRVSLDKDLEGYRPERGKVDEDGELVEDREYELKDFDRVIVIDERTKVVAKRITEYLKATDRMSRVIVFCVDTEHALRMRNALVEENQDMVAQNSKYVVRITSNDKEGKAQLDNFIDANEKYPVIATTSKLLSTGVDTKTVKLIVLDTEIASMTEFKQIIGRGTRLVPKKGKEYFTIMDFRNNSAKFADPEFDGDPVVVKPIDGGNGKTKIEPEVYNPEGNTQPPVLIDDGEDESRKKIYINNVEVTILSESVKYYDANGELITESIAEYSEKNLKKIYDNYEKFKTEWSEAENKEDFLNQLYSNGVMVEALIEEAEDTNVDIFDLLSTITYGNEIIGKKDRIEQVYNQKEFFEQFDSNQADVIKELLNVYQNKDITEIEKIDVLKLNNFDKFGGIVPVVRMFGGKDNYKIMIKKLKNLLYDVEVA